MNFPVEINIARGRGVYFFFFAFAFAFAFAFDFFTVAHFFEGVAAFTRAIDH